MKHFHLFFLSAFTGILLLAACKKSNDDEYFIEASINGVKWRAKSAGNYLALKADNSQMKIIIDSNVAINTTINFFSNSSVIPFYWTEPDFTLQNGYIAPFDSRLTIKWETSFEKNMSMFYIVRAFSSPEQQQIIDSVQCAGVGINNGIRRYSVTLPDKEIAYLDTYKYRLLIWLTGGAWYYTNILPIHLAPGPVQIIYYDAKGKLYFPLDNNQNQILVTQYDKATGESSGSFSFNYKDDSGKTIEVRDGRFHLKR